MPERCFPNLFIVGAPKCGTTAMSHYLATHPRIFMSEEKGIKEPGYFASDLAGWGAIASREDYLNIFRQAPINALYRGEASTTYLESHVAVRHIMKSSPDARLVVMIRNPVEIAQRLHNQHMKSAIENIWDFEQAWHYQSDRLQRHYLPASFSDPRAFQYGERAKIGSHLSRLFKSAPKSQIHVIVYEDFASSPLSCYRTLLTFLGVHDHWPGKLPPVNASVNFRFPRIQAGLTWAKALREQYKIPGGWGIQKIFDRYNRRPNSLPLRPSFHRELQDYFRGEVELISDLLGRDFSNWLR